MRVRKGELVRTVQAVTVLVFFLTVALSWAQSAPNLELKTTAEKETRVQQDGKWVAKRVPASQARPGDTLAYTVTYRNTGQVAAVDAVIVNPIPEGSVYRLGSAAGKDAEVSFSLDNGHTWQKPPVLVPVKKPDGTVEMKPAPPERYTQIRWIIKKPVMPGQRGKVGFKTTVK